MCYSVEELEIRYTCKSCGAELKINGQNFGDDLFSYNFHFCPNCGIVYYLP